MPVVRKPPNRDLFVRSGKRYVDRSGNVTGPLVWLHKNRDEDAFHEAIKQGDLFGGSGELRHTHVYLDKERSKTYTIHGLWGLIDKATPHDLIQEIPEHGEHNKMGV